MTELIASGRNHNGPMFSQTIISDGLWHHVGFAWDGFYRALYVDGTEVATDTAAMSSLNYLNGGMYIGADKNLDAMRFFSGLIDDVRIYDVTLTADEIIAMAR